MNKQKMSLLMPTNEICNLPMMNQSNEIQVDLKSSAMKSTVCYRNGWMYLETPDINNILNVDLSRTAADYICTFTADISKMYLSNIPTFQVDDHSLFSKQNAFVVPDDSLQASIVKVARNILKRSGNRCFECRLVLEHYSFFLSVLCTQLDGSLMFTSMLFDDITGVCKCCVDGHKPVNSKKLIRGCYTPFYIGKRDKNVKQEIKSDPNPYLVDTRTLRLIDKCLQLMINNPNYDYQNNVFEYSDTEMYLIKKMIKLVSDKCSYWPADIRNWIPPDTEYDYDFGRFDKISPDIVALKVDDEQSFPVVDLSEKEMKFITNYAASNGFICDNPKTFNLLPYISDMSYGDTFRYPLIHREWGKFHITTTFILDDDVNSLRILLIFDIPKNGLTVFSSVDFKNVHEFNLTDSLNHMNTSILFRDTNNLPSKEAYLFKMIPPCFISPEDIFDIAGHLLALYIVMHDRPTRTRMVRCTRSVPADSKRKKNKKDTEYVITRILKTAQDAKEYVAKMTSNGYTDREYFLESWKRKGYYRRTRGGEVVWIPPTICHRHKPLTEKEVHIKL